MKIRKSEPADLPAILDIYAQAREFMEQNGNPNQWGKTHPASSIIEEDIQNGNSYVCEDDGEITGTFFFARTIEPTYLEIYNGNWQSDEPYGVIHRIASAGGKRGTASFCLEWCYAKCGNIRIDTHKDNIPMQNLLKKNGYKECGIIYLENGDERLGFQKASR